MPDERPEQDEPNRAPGQPAFYDDPEEDGPAPDDADDDGDAEGDPEPA